MTKKLLSQYVDEQLERCSSKRAKNTTTRFTFEAFVDIFAKSTEEADSIGVKIGKDTNDTKDTE